MTNEQLANFIGLLLAVLPVVAGYLSGKKGSAAGALLREPAAQTVTVTNGNGNGHKIAAVAGRQEEASKRLDDFSRHLDEVSRRFETDINTIRSELNSVVATIERKWDERMNEFIEKGRSKEDSWLIQFNKIRREFQTGMEQLGKLRQDLREDALKREQTRTDEFAIVKTLVTDVAILKQKVDTLTEMVQPREQ